MTTAIARPDAAPAAPVATGGGQFAGTARLLRLALRRDRIRIPAWTLVLAGMTTASYSATAGLYPDAAMRRPAAEIFNTAPSLVAMFGRVYDPDSLGSLATIKLTAFYGAAVSILMVFQAVRHTRADEDAGRVELLSSTVVGRLAPLAAAMAAIAVFATAIWVAVAVALIAAGAAVPGAIAFGLAWAVMGLASGMFTILAAQILPEARAAIAAGVAAVGISYLMRGIGDMSDPGPGLLSWLSPIGWGQQIRPFAGDRFVFAGIPVLVSLGLGFAAMYLRGRRDLGSGMLGERRGQPGTTIASPLRLSLRLNRGLLLGWAIGLGAMGFVVGSIADSMGGFFDDPNMMSLLEKIGGRKGMIDLFLGVEIGIISVFASAAGIAVIGHLRREEEAGRTEVVLAGPTSRPGWLAGSVIVAVVGVAALLALLGLAVGAGAATALGDPGQVPRLALAALARVPATWVMVGVAVALYGYLPRLVPLSYALLLGFLVLGDFAQLWGLPSWVSDMSPFQHSPNLPGADFELLPILVLSAVAATLFALGFAGWARRDLRGA